LNIAKKLFLLISVFVFLQPLFSVAMDDDWVLVEEDPEPQEQASQDTNQSLLSKFEAIKTELESLKKSKLELEKANFTALKWAIDHGTHPKIIKKLHRNKKSPLSQALCALDLDESRKALIQRHEGYCFETAMKTDNLNFVKQFLPSDDPSFNATAFYLAALNRSQKIASYLALDNALITDDTIHVLYNIFSETFPHRSLESVTIVFRSNLGLKPKQWRKLIKFGMEEAKKYDFVEATDYLIQVEQAIECKIQSFCLVK
jgi:hypothetical protein